MNNTGHDKEFEEESKKLCRTISVMKIQISLFKEKVKKLIGEMKKFNPATDNMGIFFGMEEAEKVFLKKIRDYEQNMSIPYFSSIDVVFKDSGKNKFYIGKCTVNNDDTNQLEVIDWRAPISSVYYDGRLGEVSYEAPEGTINCTLTNKRMYSINDGKLESYSDVDVTANDELLKPYLEVSSDTRLKNIISTIQKEQNKVIRSNMNKPLIVQGVAGSGKTTAALHRIAYLVYQNEKILKPSDFVIIAPNKLFLDYISEVLPDLGVEDVNQLTFEEFAKSYLEMDFRLNSYNLVLLNAIESSKNKENGDLLLKVSSLKGSIDYKEAIDRYFKDVSTSCLPDCDLRVADVVILDKQELAELFMNEIYLENDSFDNLFEKFINRLSKVLQRKYSVIENAIISRRSERIEDLKAMKLTDDDLYEQRIKIYNEYDYVDLFKNDFKKFLNIYSKKKKKKTVMQHYRTFVENIDKYLIDGEEGVINYLKKRFSESKNTLDIEDLPALMYIKRKSDGKNQKDMAKHIVIDEAQDYSPFQLFMLKEILNNDSMTVLGDIAQGIYSYRGIKDWNYINRVVFDGNADIVILDKSYRTTIEIMDLGNKVIEHIAGDSKFTRAVPVIRSGKPVQITKLDSFDDIISNIDKTLQALIDDKQNIAIITKNSLEAKEIYNALTSKTNLQIQLISEDANDYKGGIVVMPTYLSKGLEFDSVIISNANDENYLENEMDAKLLYVAITRAMHTLDIFYIGNLTKLI